MRKPPFTVGDRVRIVRYSPFRIGGAYDTSLEAKRFVNQHIGSYTTITAVYRCKSRLRYHVLASGRQISWEATDFERLAPLDTYPWERGAHGLFVHPKFTLGDTVYLKDDPERTPRKITKIAYKDIWTHKPTSDIVYTLDNEHGELHDECELITTKPITVF